MTVYYRICVTGHLDTSWSAWFDDLTITHEANGETVLAGPLPDQAALYGILEKARNLNLRLVFVYQIPLIRSEDGSLVVVEHPDTLAGTS